MREFRDKVAVITGGASGIGKSMAHRFLRAGMKVVVADIQDDALAAITAEFKVAGQDVLVVKTDVTDPESLETLARRTVETYGRVDILCNNAGVADPPAAIWESTVNDWQWMFGVNFWGVINGVRAFVPIMLKQGEDAHIVNTSSIDGLLYGSGPGGAVYAASKHATVNASESLYMQLKEMNSRISVSVLCPGPVTTPIIFGARNRPPHLNDDVGVASDGSREELQKRIARFLEDEGIDPDDVADIVLDGIREERFYILPQSEFDHLIRDRMEGIIQRRNWEPVDSSK